MSYRWDSNIYRQVAEGVTDADSPIPAFCQALPRKRPENSNYQEQWEFIFVEMDAQLNCFRHVLAKLDIITNPDQLGTP